MIVYTDGGEEWYPVYSTLAQKDREHYIAIEVTPEEWAKIERVQREFGEVQELIRTRQDEARAREPG